MDIFYKVLVQINNKLLIVHQLNVYALWIRLGDLKSLPTDENIWTAVITCGGVRRGRGWRGWWGGAPTLPFIDCPSGGTSSELEAQEARDSPAFGSEEEVNSPPKNRN